ncbi:hypothetical protein BEWA_026870 [Theileria equi strain WA]|uniref:Uncharacterized protein n=1 Tax=Theileria equi strain WA TaxID=1537102 RepID=L0AX62_THEEQ|nr:hypothetical protein BEWA_026870 [Theileria equi strain WA]AFZ79838.1 hypothetical protein BEWA_026870 [Theileria equi strain WA]|eukprot:XP_004829504.1 hypothetical protein BEWA_026870 [Theileria equi strain WA]
MGAGRTCNDSGRKSIYIDIGNKSVSGSYTDTCRNKINISVDASIKSNTGLTGYKRYTHTPVDRPYYITEIHHHKKPQSSIDVTGGGRYEKKVTVYYLSYDDSNLVPAVVGLEKTRGDNRYDYYTRTNLSTYSPWKGEENHDVDQESQLLSKLTEISPKLNTLIVLNLTQTQGTYYANGEITKPPDSNQDTNINVTESGKVHNCYERFTHKPGGGIDRMRLLSTKKGGTSIPFEDPMIYTTPYSEAYVYFWEGDSSHTSPLILQLGESTFYKLHGKKWKHESGINEGTLKKKLDKENCAWNQAHVAKIAEKGTGSGTNYQCIGCSKPITVRNYPVIGYSYSIHYIAGSYIRRFKDGGTEQIELALTGKISSVYVYHYPLTDGIPLLIRLSGSSAIWFEKESIDSNNWKQISNNPQGNYLGNNTNILKLLRAKLPTVTIDLGKTNATSGSDTEYHYPSGEDEKDKINVTINKLAEGFIGFSHSVLNKSAFILGGVKYGEGTAFSGISSSSILKGVTAYYDGNGPEFQLENLLMVKLEKRGTGSNNYEYYTRGDEDKDGTTWTVLEGFGKTEKLETSELTTKLKNLKEELDKPSSPSGLQGPNGASGPSGPGDGDGQGSVTYSIQKFFEQILDTIRSHPAEIGGAVGGTIGTGILGFGTWKLWSKIMSCLITKAI